MLNYFLQSVLLGGILILLARQPRGFNTYQVLFAVVWTVAVIAIRFRYGDGQVVFYSNDQETQLWLLRKFTKYGFSFSPNIVIFDRYIVVIPARMLNLFGIDPLLAFKFLQAVSLSLIYKICSDFLTREGISQRLWHAILFAGPLFIFLSTIGLRDLEIALVVTYFFIGRQHSLKLVALGATALLRPHLSLALMFGWIIANYLDRYKPKRVYLVLTLLTLSAFAIGGYGYSAGGYLKYRVDFLSPKIFEQDAWWRFFANLLGIQFLTFTDSVIKMPVSQLIALRLFFVDTFAIPLLFVFTLLGQRIKFSVLRTQVFISFAFFLGLVAQTNFNSSRQNLPFLSTMGVLALAGVLKSREANVKQQTTLTPNMKSNK